MFFRFYEFSEPKLLQIRYRRNASVTLKSELKSKPIKEQAVFLYNCECKVSLLAERYGGAFLSRTAEY